MTTIFDDTPTRDAGPATGITIYRPEFIPVKYLQVRAGVRYYEDATVNGQREDDENPTIPCRDECDYWAPLIDIEAGRIVNWTEGTTASVLYKVCDDGRYALLREDMTEVFAIDGYVPDIMSPGDRGYGDYIIMDIGADGKIADWVVDLERFEQLANAASSEASA